MMMYGDTFHIFSRQTAVKHTEKYPCSSVSPTTEHHTVTSSSHSPGRRTKVNFSSLKSAEGGQVEAYKKQQLRLRLLRLRLSHGHTRVMCVDSL